MFGLSLTIVLVFTPGCISLAEQAIKVTDQTVIREVPATARALESIVQIAKANKIPLGIVVSGDTLCTTTLRLSSAEIRSVSDLEVAFGKQVTGHELKIEDETLVVKPSSPGGPEPQFLALPIDNFMPIDTSLSGVNAFLWVYIRAISSQAKGL